MSFLANFWWVFVLLVIVFSGLLTVNQGTIAVITMFGKYQRILTPGLRFKIPLVEQIYKRVSIHLSFRQLPAIRPMYILKACCCILFKMPMRKPLKK
jgi:regulator of protease activity HflC (stomatin/prohibitin superfamily)